MKNRNKNIEQIICSAVNDFAKICGLSVVKSNGSFIVFVDGKKILTLSTKYEKENFFISITCHMEENVSTIREITLQQIFQDEELRGFLENINDELVVDNDSDLILNSSWEFAYKDYAILRSSIVFILTETLRNKNHVFEFLDAREAKLNEVKSN